MIATSSCESSDAHDPVTDFLRMHLLLTMNSDSYLDCSHWCLLSVTVISILYHAMHCFLELNDPWSAIVVQRPWPILSRRLVPCFLWLKPHKRQSQRSLNVSPAWNKDTGTNTTLSGLLAGIQGLVRTCRLARDAKGTSSLCVLRYL